MIVNLDDLIQLQVLKLKASVAGQNPDNAKFVDGLVERGDVPIELRQMCAKVSPALYDRVTQICEALDLSKRQFIEAVVVEAVRRAEEALSRAGLDDQREL